MSTTDQPSNDVTLQEQLILFYSKMVDWFETCPWYRDDSVVKVIHSLIPANPPRVLELCCGTGLLLDSLSQVLPDTEFVGVDICPTMFERARERVAQRKNVAVLNQDWVYGLGPEWNNAFDVIIVKNALHLLSDLPRKLKDLRRVARACNSLVVVETVSPNVQANRFIRRLFQIVDPAHVKQVFFTERTLMTVLRESGWLLLPTRPLHVRQHIDTEDWLEQKCTDRIAREKARKLLSSVRNLRIRRAMDFDSHLGVVPSRMLRLQYVAPHVFRPTVNVRANVEGTASAGQTFRKCRTQLVDPAQLVFWSKTL